MGSKQKRLIEDVVSWGNLMAAHRLCRRGKRDSREVIRFEANLWAELGAIQNELLWGTYDVGRYRRFLVYDPKRREIAAAPYRDRVVMQAICRACEPIWTKAMIPDAYACVKGRGPHEAVFRLQQWQRYYRRRGERAWALHLDVSKFFDSIPHEVVMRVLRRRIACPRTLQALDTIITSTAGSDERNPVGIPTGNLTSQWLGNLVLNEIDQVAKRQLRIRHYQRYMDDLLILHSSKAQLRDWRDAIEAELGKLGLTAGKANISPAEGVTWVGFRVWPHKTRVKGQTLRRIRKKVRGVAIGYGRGRISRGEARDSLQSWRAHVLGVGMRGWWAARVREARALVAAQTK